MLLYFRILRLLIMADNILNILSLIQILCSKLIVILSLKVPSKPEYDSDPYIGYLNFRLHIRAKIKNKIPGNKNSNILSAKKGVLVLYGLKLTISITMIIKYSVQNNIPTAFISLQ